MLRNSLATAIAIAIAVVPACKPRGAADDSATSAIATAPDQAPITLPKPHALEETPAIAAYVGDPAAAHAVATATLPGIPPQVNVVALVLATKAPAELAESMAPHIAEHRPWVGARIAGEDILHLPLREGELDAAQALLDAYPAAGEFGAVSLPAAGIDVGQLANAAIDPDADPDAAPDPDAAGGGAPPQLAWIDRETASLTIAATPAGLLTGREMVKGYADQPIWLTVDASMIRPLVDAFPYDRISAAGPGLDDITVTLDADPARGLPASAELAPGALTNLHSGPALALAVSTRWAKHAPEVSSIIRQINKQVDSAGFAAKIMLEPLAQQAIAVLRSWNGRVFAGLGPSRHLAIGLGADDPRKAGATLNRFLRAAIDNLELARMFVSDIPQIGLRRHSKDPEVQVLTLKGIKKSAPAAMAPLFDERGTLSIAYSYSVKSGAVFAMIGPEPETAIAVWAEAIADAPPASEAEGDLIAATIAISPAKLQELLQTANPTDANALIAASVDLEAGRAPTQLVIRQEPSRYVVTSQGPKVAGPQVRQGG